MINKIKKENFVETIKSKPYTVVKFGAPWCGPCKMANQVLSQIKNIDVYEVNIDEEPDLAEEYKIAHIPAVMVFDKDLKILKQFGGLINKDEVQTFVDTLNA